MSWRDFRCKNQHHKESRDLLIKIDCKNNYKTVEKVKIKIKLMKYKQTKANP